MDVPREISNAYDLLKADLVDEAEAGFQAFLDTYSEEDDIRSRAMTGMAMIRRRQRDYPAVLEFATASVGASGPRPNLSWGFIQEAASEVYPHGELTHGKCNICQSDLVCPPGFNTSDVCCPYHEGVNIDWQT